ncbi:hypothetical protein M0R45_024250 [Rubus argutus]|uniref:Uncharacterized protein n=1 Tax=Rubus argutus TaxID=59490 RepID=A0AAW1WUS8_RUBAR
MCSGSIELASEVLLQIKKWKAIRKHHVAVVAFPFYGMIQSSTQRHLFSAENQIEAAGEGWMLSRRRVVISEAPSPQRY